MWKKRGCIYDGDWKEDLRHGFGTYSVKRGDGYMKKYAGGWKNDMRHVSTSVLLVSYSMAHDRFNSSHL